MALHLHRMNSNVNTTLQQRVVNFLSEQALATNVCQRLAENLVASRLDDHDIQCVFFLQLRV